MELTLRALAQARGWLGAPLKMGASARTRWFASLRYRRDIQKRPRVAEPFLYMVPRGGIEPPTRGFSILCSTD